MPSQPSVRERARRLLSGEVGEPAVIEVPAPLRAPRRAVGRSVLVAAIVLLVLALVVLVGRVVMARAAAVPTPVPGPQGLVTRSVPTAWSTTTASSSVVVHVVGAIARPGVVTLQAGARVTDALTAAGGPTDKADLARVNLARLVVDGEQLMVPVPGEAIAESAASAPPDPGRGGAGAGRSGPGADSTRSSAMGKVNLNTATLAELDGLPGVGPVLAQRILDWRSQHGRFSSVEELGEVSGVGEKMLSQLRAKVTL